MCIQICVYCRRVMSVNQTIRDPVLLPVLSVQTLSLPENGSAASGGTRKNEATAPRPPVGSMLLDIENALQPREANVTLHRQTATFKQDSSVVHGIVKSGVMLCVPERPVRAVWQLHGASAA